MKQPDMNKLIEVLDELDIPYQEGGFVLNKAGDHVLTITLEDDELWFDEQDHMYIPPKEAEL